MQSKEEELAVRRLWYAKNKDNINARKRELRKTEKYKAKARENKKKHKAKEAERVRLDRIKNPEKYSARFKRYYDKNKEEMRQRRMDYYWQNWEKSKADSRNRFAYRKYGITDKHRAEEVEKLLKSQKNKCINCLCELSKGNFHVDHIMPLSLGGENTYKNLQILCVTCNLKKNRKDPIIWAQQNGRLL